MHSSFPQRRAAADSCTKKQHALTHASISVAKLVPFTFLSAISNTFNPLFKVLFIFPSCYLFAIGLKLIFSFRWNLPPTLRSTSKERDSEITRRAHRAANAIKDSHPHRCSFSRGFHLRLMLATRLNATIQSRSFSFQAELFPVHSPLLREFCLVYFPPLTYMLKFSRFADLTSCCSSWEKICKQICKYWTICAESFSLHAPHITNSCTVAHKKQHTHCIVSTSTEAGILPGITQKCNMRSNIHWFTEFCNSQRLSHFAAFFIDAWAEISVAESCRLRSICEQ